MIALSIAGLVVAGLACWWAYVAAAKSREAVMLTKEALDVAREALGIQRMELETSPVSTDVTDNELFVLRLVEGAGMVAYGVYNIGAASHSTKSVNGRPVVPVAIDPSNQFFFSALDSLTRSGLLHYDTNGAKHTLTEGGRRVIQRWRGRSAERQVHFG